VVRWGGEEFLIVLPGCPLDAAHSLAEHMRTSLAAQDDATVGQVTMSLGVAAWQAPEDSAELLRRTDQALYHAKGQGRNQVAVAR
jgi:diguanylate cyclase (GGDEF)-like protein